MFCCCSSKWLLSIADWTIIQLWYGFTLNENIFGSSVLITESYEHSVLYEYEFVKWASTPSKIILRFPLSQKKKLSNEKSWLILIMHILCFEPLMKLKWEHVKLSLSTISNAHTSVPCSLWTYLTVEGSLRLHNENYDEPSCP